MKRLVDARSPLTWVLIGAVLCLLISSIAPPLYNNQTRPLPLGEGFTITSEPTVGKLMDVERFEAEEAPTGFEDNPDCQADDSPMYCYIEDEEMTYERSVITGEEEIDDAATETEAMLQVLTGARAFIRVSESSLLNRESTYPMPGDVNSQTVELPIIGGKKKHENFERDGLKFFFPSGTEQRSYPYYDAMAQASVPIDYTDDTRMDGIPVFAYHQSIDPVPMQGKDLEMDTYSGPAWKFFDEEDRDTYGLQRDSAVVMEPFYTASRDLWVEPTTGTIVDSVTNFKVFWATDAQQAQEMLDNNDTDARSMLSAESRWSEKSKQERLDSVRPVINTIKALSVVSVVGKIIGIALLIAAAVMYVRRYRAS